MLLAGLPVSVPATTVNRLCGSCLDAAMIALPDDRDRRRRRRAGRRRGVDDPGAVGAAQAVARRSRPATSTAVSTTLGWRLVNARMPAEWTVSLGEANEQLRREVRDLPGAAGRVRRPLAPARRRGLGRRASTTTSWCRSPAPSSTRDEGIRPGTHAGEAGGAQAVVPPRRHHHRRQRLAAQRRRLRRAARLRDGRGRASALDPLARIAGRGASRSSRRSSGTRRSRRPSRRCARAGIGWSDVGAVELNEAFAVQSLACVDAWGIDPEIVNARAARSRSATRSAPPAAGSSARWPSGCASRGERWGVAAICIGVGQGLAVVLENVAGGVVMTNRSSPTTPDEAVAGIADGATVLIGGFGMAGMPVELIDALIRQGATDLTVVNNNAGNGDTGLAALLAAGPGAQDDLLVPAAVRLLGLRRALPAGQDRARAGAAGQPRRADAGRRRRHRRVLQPDRRRHAAGRGQGDPRRSTAATTCWSTRSTATSR